jgi:tRNAThr (cytosine32-N3)-methyltransferase
MTDPLAPIFAALMTAHDADPERTPDGRAAERLYAERVMTWMATLRPDASPALRVAACAQHLERWSLPRSAFPMDRVGYLTWRKTVHARQGERVEALILGAGGDAALAARVRVLVAKAAPKGDPDGQAMEDAACLVFIAHEMADFAADHPDYTKDKWLEIIRKTWRKMSPAAHAHALTIALPAPLAALVQEAVTGA